MNEVRFISEKIGGRPPSQRRLRRFNDSFPESYTHYLEPGLSDHAAILVHLSPELFKRLGAFINGTPQYRLVKKLQNVKFALKAWNRDIFGNVQSKVKEGRRPIDRFQAALHQSLLDPILILQEHEARIEYLQLLAEEESFIRQKSRQNSIQLGDSNLAFFYAALASRKARNTLREVKKPDGTLSDNPDDVRAETINLFSQLLNRESHLEVHTFTFPSRLSDHDNASLYRLVTAEEVWEILRGMKSSSNPGPDGFSATFFKATWHLIKDDVVAAEQSFFEPGGLLKQVFYCRFVGSISSISLCNTIYKLITKLMASRLQDYLPHLISHHQTTFIKGRKISQSSLLAHELFSILHKSKSIGRTCLKMDLSKAFDSVQWPFLRKVMEGMGFCEKWITWIMQCVQTPKFFVLVNGSPCGFFSSSNGLRQGDPFSPLLFVIGMEALSHMLNSAIEEGRLGKFIKSKHNVSHLAFANDLMVFTDSSSESALALKILFEDFSHWSGPDEVNHLFFHCGFSSYIWKSLLSSCRTLLDWILWLDKLPIQGIVKNIVKATLASAVGIIWRERCVRVFQSKSKPKPKSMLLKDIIDTVRSRVMRSRLNCDPIAETEHISTHFGIYFPAHKYMAIAFS
ncbi:hypothetical protein QJS04_geneDACA006635 [Acorus gramineus]|uniref:Reverse transcriptase domain-containing protein n=1 Tax=Acorus gramineus TaxID=55184 RepID=A0AAV9A2P3_ACOGR|nr:hypothetical protein QJS04_geneDACA006635 [Acorus gramineus]